MKQYFVICRVDNDESYSVETEKSLAELWESNDDAGYIEEIEAYDPQDNMRKIDVYEVARSYIVRREESQREYEEYCEYINEYGYDYRDEME